MSEPTDFEDTPIVPKVPVDSVKKSLLDNWKKVYSNESATQSVDEFDKIADQFTVYKLDYNYNSDLPKVDFMFRNFLNGLSQSLDELGVRNQLFVKIVGTYATFDMDDNLVTPAQLAIYLIVPASETPPQLVGTEFTDYYTWTQMTSDLNRVTSNASSDSQSVQLILK